MNFAFISTKKSGHKRLYTKKECVEAKFKKGIHFCPVYHKEAATGLRC